MQALLSEHDTELLPKNQTAQAVKTLSEAKRELAAALRNFQDQKEEIESNEKRLSGAQKEEQDLLKAAMDEQEQIRKLGEVVTRRLLLDSRIEQGRNRLESSEGELRHAADEAFRSFWQAITTLRDARQAKNLARLKEMVNPEQWPWAEPLAVSFIRFASDMVPLDLLGDQAYHLLQVGAVRKAAEHLLVDIAKLEGEAAGS